MLRVIAAESLFGAASEEPARSYRPDILDNYQELLAGRVDASDYLI
ncbi:hypothetical protein BOO71_0002431 [Deinococcus marmoris]|uniref:Uncharacterized protein n=1 Tax=Deinococcus marmoris TaxID=249408 RepID=A0A1U7P325_9DEIO|nr:hypothetical protein BOO71_0002431 [Deinococcus marmoris]